MKPTTDDVLKWARSVGMEITDDPFVNFNVWELKRVCAFAYAAGAAAMKERAAKECEIEAAVAVINAPEEYQAGREMGATICAAAIRALGDDDD